MKSKLKILITIFFFINSFLNSESVEIYRSYVRTKYAHSYPFAIVDIPGYNVYYPGPTNGKYYYEVSNSAIPVRPIYTNSPFLHSIAIHKYQNIFRVTGGNGWINFYLYQMSNPMNQFQVEVSKFKSKADHVMVEGPHSDYLNLLSSRYFQFKIRGRYKDGGESKTYNGNHFISDIYHVVVDRTPPAVGALNLDPHTVSQTYYNTTNGSYYFRPPLNINFLPPTISEGGSGLYGARLFYRNIHTNQITGDTNFVYENLNSSIYAYYLAEDNVHNVSTSNTLTLIADPTSPSIILNSLQFFQDEDQDVSQFRLDFKFNINDSQSGLADARISTNGGYEDFTPAGGFYQFARPNFSRDVLYTYQVYARDHVDNINETSPVVFGVTHGPVYDGDKPPAISFSDGEYHIDYNVQLKRYFGHDVIGYSSLDSYIGDTKVHSITRGEINSRYNTALGGQNPEDLDPIEDILPITFSTSIDRTALEPHSVNEIYAVAQYMSGYSESSWDNTPYYLTLPNAGFDASNNFSLKFYRNNEVIEDFSFADLAGKDSSLFYIDTFQLQLDGAGGNGKDVEGDKLYLRLTTADQTVDIPAFEGRITFDGQAGTIATENGGVIVSQITLNEIRSVSIIEEFDREYFDDNTKEIKTTLNHREEFPLELSIHRDTDFFAELIDIRVDEDDTAGHQWEQILATNDGTFKWHINYGTDTQPFNDTSGIQYVSFFEYPREIENFALNDFKNLDPSRVVTKEFALGEDYRVDLSESLFLLEEQTVGTASHRRIGVYIQDFAGHYKILTQKVYYDRLAPAYLDPHGGTIRWFASEDTAENLSYRSFDRTGNVVTLTLALDEALYGGLEGCTITPSVNAPFPVSAVLVDQEFVEVTIPQDFPSDVPLELTMLFTDYAGNSTENRMTLYTPLYFTGTYTNYIAQTSREWDDQGDTPLGHYLEWNQISLPDNELLLYDTVSGQRITAASGFGDFVHAGLTAHDEREYLLRGRNRSGYESDFVTADAEGITTGFLFTRKLLNNSPFVTLYEEIGVYEGGSETYLGPLNTLIIHFADHDETDDFLLRYYVNGEFYKEQEVSGTLGAGGLKHEISVQDFFDDFENDQIYEIRYEILDYWLKDSMAEEGTIVLNTPKNYRYDSVKPDLADFLYDKREGFAYIHKDIHLNIVDEGAGLISRVLYESVDGELVDLTNGISLSDGNDLEDYSHLISQIPDLRDYTLHLRMEDGVGNFKIQSIGPFSKDSITPVLTEARIDSLENLFSRPSVPITARWTDNLSGASKLLYQFADGATILKSGEVAASGDLLGLLSGEWAVTCSLSESLLEDKDYTLQVKILDNAGNGMEADWSVLAEDITIDSTAPVVRITGQNGWSFNKGQYYLNSPGSFSLGHEILDAYPSNDVWYELERGDGALRSGASLDALLAGLADGESWELRILTRDRAGNQGSSSPFAFSVDTTSPDSQNFSLEILNQQPSYSKGEQVRFRFRAQDSHSGIDRFVLWVGRSVEGSEEPVISRLLPGHLGDGTVVMDYVEGKTYSLNLPDVPQGSYFFKAAAVDLAGNRSALTILGGQALGLVESTESLVVQDFNVYHNDPHLLSAWWEYEGEKEFNHYAYRVIDAETTQPVSDWEFTFKQYGSVRFAEALQEGKIYYFEVYTGFGDGSRSASRFSPGALIDLTDPEIRSVSLPRYGTLADLKLDWEAEDLRSAIGDVQVRLDTYAVDENGRIRTETFDRDGVIVTVPLREELGTFSLGRGGRGEGVQVLQAEGYETLDIADGQRLLLTLRASDLAGNVTEKYCGIFTNDSSAPPVPVVLDGGEFVNPLKDTVRADWSWSRQDPHSGNASYAYQVLLGEAELDPDGWIPVDASSVELTGAAAYANGSLLTIAVRAVNGAGLPTVGYSDGIVLDHTKPAAAEVKLLGPEGEEISYLLGRSAGLSIVSEDAQSGISRYRYEPGIFVGTDWKPLSETYTEVPAGEEILSVTIPDSLQSLGVIFYKATAFNAAGDISLPGYSSGAKLFEGVPLLTNLTGESVRGDLQFSWDVDETIPLTAITLRLKKSGIVIDTVTVEGHVRDYLYTGVEDGIYELLVDYTAANSASSGETLASAPVYVDTTAPTVSDLDYTAFVNDLFRYSFLIRDNLTGGNGYRFRIGPTGAPDLLTEGWRWLDSTGSYQEKTVSFLEEFAGGYDCLEDGGTILFSCQVQDLAGNWSDIAYSTPILVDRTAPEMPVVDMNRQILVGETPYLQESYFLTESDTLRGISIEGIDRESGITGYRWALREQSSTEDLSWSDILPYEAEEGDKRISLAEEILTGVILKDKSAYHLYVQTINGSGILSASGASPVLTADLAAPLFEVALESSGIDTESTDNGTGLIYNTSGNLHLRILDEAGEVLNLTYSLIDPSSAEGESLTEYYLGSGTTDLTLPFAPVDLEEYGNYRMRIALSDAGGYESVLYQDIRLNSPPSFALQDVVSHPMKPFDLTLSEWVSDQDDVVNAVIRIDHHGLSDEWNQPVLENLTDIALDHEEIFAGETSFTYAVTAEDRYGVSASSEGTILIVNTAEGTLYADEFWLGDHQITGTVTVPEGLKLSLAEGTTVQAVTGAETPDVGLIVLPGAELDHLGSATYQLFDPSLGIPWDGLFIRGAADLSGITVKGAKRGVTLKSSLITEINGSTFAENLIGLHLLGIPPLIQDCRFTGNVFYGIKEDEGSRPVVKDNLFTGNGYDYYDLDRTVLSAGELNSLEDNSGNRGDN